MIKSLRARAVEAIAEHERATAERAEEQAARETERLSNSLRSILTRLLGVEDPGLPPGALAVTLEGGLVLKIAASRYGTIARPGVTCEECGAFGCFAENGIDSLAELGLAYRQLERLAGGTPCDVTGDCGRRRPRPEPRGLSLVARRLWEVFDAVDRGLPVVLDREERLSRLAEAAERAMQDDLEEAQADRTLGAALRTWTQSELERRGV